MIVILTPLKDRFLKKVSLNGPTPQHCRHLGPCWPWTGALKSHTEPTHAYGVIGKGRRGEGLLQAARVSWEIYRGPIPDGLWVLHRCDNPRCVNPGHLWLGTREDNIRDMHEKNRGAFGERDGKSKLTTAQAKAIFHDSRSAKMVAKDYGVAEWTVRDIKIGRNWAKALRQEASCAP
jgi:hypothetical protein